MIFRNVPVSDDGVATCGLRAVRNGTGRGVTVSWSYPRPLDGIGGDGGELLSWDGEPAEITGKMRLGVYDADLHLFHETPIDLDFRPERNGGKRVWFGWDGVPTSFEYDAAWGSSTLFRLLIDEVVFSDVEWRDASWRRHRGPVSARVMDHFLFRQRGNGISYGQGGYALLAWPWQDSR